MGFLGVSLALSPPVAQKFLSFLPYRPLVRPFQILCPWWEAPAMITEAIVNPAQTISLLG